MAAVYTTLPEAQETLRDHQSALRCMCIKIEGNQAHVPTIIQPRHDNKNPLQKKGEAMDLLTKHGPRRLVTESAYGYVMGGLTCSGNLLRCIAIACTAQEGEREKQKTDAE